MIFFNPADQFTSPPTAPWTATQMSQVVYRLRQHQKAFNIRPDEHWFIKKLNTPVYQELYSQLALDKPMNAFLKEGDLTLFRNNHLEFSTRDKAYFSFWKPFFVERYAHALSLAYQERKAQAIELLTPLPFDLSSTEQQVAFAKIDSVIKEDLEKLHGSELQIRNQKNVAESLHYVNALVPVQLLNSLPQHFQAARASFCEKLIELSMQVFNLGSNNDAAWQLAQRAYRLNTPGELREKLTSWKETLAKYIKSSNLLDEYQAEIKEQQVNLDNLESLYQKTETKSISSKALQEEATPFIQPEGLARLPDRFKFFTEDYLSYLRTFSAYSWNKYQENSIARYFLDQAERLPLNEEQRIILAQDKKDLKDKQNQLKKDTEEAVENAREDVQVRRAGVWPGLFLAALLLGFFAALIGNWHMLPDIPDSSPPVASRDTESTYRPSSSGTYMPIEDQASSSSSGTNSEATPTPRYTPPIISESDMQESDTTAIAETLPIEGANNATSDAPSAPPTSERSSATTYTPPVIPVPETGIQPYDDVLGESEISNVTENWVEFNNTASLDVVVLLVDYLTSKTTRNAYIRSGERHRMNNVPTGDYLIFVHFGKNWDPNHPIPGTNVQGGFTQNASFYQLRLPGNRLELYDLNNNASTYRTTIKDPASDKRLRQMTAEDYFTASN
jgi:hypothetical protein